MSSFDILNYGFIEIEGGEIELYSRDLAKGQHLDIWTYENADEIFTLMCRFDKLS